MLPALDTFKYDYVLITKGNRPFLLLSIDHKLRKYFNLKSYFKYLEYCFNNCRYERYAHLNTVLHV